MSEEAPEKPPATERMRSSKRRLQLLDTTMALIRSDGLAAVTMERVAERAKVSKPVLYSHFGNRTALLLALLEHHWELIDRLLKERLPANPTLEEHYVALLESYFQALDRQGAAVHELLDPSAAEPALDVARRNRFHSKEMIWSQRYQHDLHLSPEVADVAAAIIRSGITACGDYWLSHPEVDPKVCVAACVAIVQGGLSHLRQQPIGSSAQ